MQVHDVMIIRHLPVTPLPDLTLGSTPHSVLCIFNVFCILMCNVYVDFDSTVLGSSVRTQWKGDIGSNFTLSIQHQSPVWCDYESCEPAVLDTCHILHGHIKYLYTTWRRQNICICFYSGIKTPDSQLFDDEWRCQARQGPELEWQAMTQAINCSSPVSHRQCIAVLPDLATMEVESNVLLTNQRPSLTLMLTTYYVFWGLLIMNFLDLDANQMQQHYTTTTTN